MTPLAKKVFELFGKQKADPEVEGQRTGEALSPPWPCPKCDGQVILDLTTDCMPTRFWHCETCRTWGATREGVSAPAVWVSSGVLH